MKCKGLILILLTVFIAPLKAQYEGAANSAIGVRGVTTAELFSVNVNPANLGMLDSAQIGLNIKKWSFAGRTLESGLQMMAPLKNVNLGIGIYNFGNSYYNFGKVSFALAKALDPKQGIGISADYYKEFVYLNTNARAINASIGYYYKPNTKVQMGAAIRQVFYRSDKRLERSYSQMTTQGALGITFKSSDNLSFTGEFVSDEINAFGMGLGMRLQRERYALLLGLSNQENLINAGLQTPLVPVQWILAYAFHQQLGSSVQSSLIHHW